MSRSLVRPRMRTASAKKSHLQRVALESLEPRTLMAVLPPVTHDAAAANPVDASTGAETGGSNMSAPKIAVDPNDPSKVVAVWVDLDPANVPQSSAGVQSVITGAYSINGGASWLPLSGFSNRRNDDDPTTSNPVIPYIQATDPSVAFDRQNHVYVLSSEHNSGGTSGEFVMSTYDFSGNSPKSLVSDNVIKKWEANPGSVPVLAVDSNVDRFFDPTTGAVQNDTFGGSTNLPGNSVGNVYVGWAVNNTYPFTGTVPGNYNPNRIQIVSSSDGGKSFGPVEYVDNTGFTPGGQRYTAPSLAVAQGVSGSSTVTGGLVTVGFDDTGSGANANIPFDVLMANEIQPGASQAFNGGGSGVAASPGSVTSTTNVALDPRFTTLQDISVTVNIRSQSLTNFTLTLTSPGGQVYTLMNTGLSGSNIGIDGNGNSIGATFDLNAQASFRNASAFAAPWAGYSLQPDQPAGGSGQLSLGSLKNSGPGVLNGQWTLTASDTTNDNANVQIASWTLHLTSGLSHGAESTINAKNYVRNNAPVANSAMPQGITPGLVLAYDNTLGSFSPHEGRLYAVYTNTYPAALNGIYSINPADNTDIELMASDDGGVSWKMVHNIGTFQIPVNDDNGALDGFSGTVNITDGTTGVKITGRPQFEPSVAVDPTTGTLVVSYLDTRYDASRSRVATTIATSLDGGTTFGPQTFANQANTALDEITQKNVILGPVPENQSGGNSKTDSTFGFGPSQGLAALSGHIYAAWSSNDNGGPTDGNTTKLLHIAVAPMDTAAGPRIISSTMGPVQSTSVNGTTFNNQFSITDGTQEIDGFVVVFDRRVDINTFDKTSVQVQYRSPTGVTSPVLVSSVTPLDSNGFGATTFLVHLTSAQSAVGTYSYEINASKIRDLIRTNHAQLQVIPDPNNPYTEIAPATVGVNQQNLNLLIPALGTGGSNTNNDFTTSQNPVTDVPVASVVTGVTVTVNLNHSRDGDLILTLISPDGTSVVLARNLGNNGQNYTNTTFDQAAAQSILGAAAPFTGTFRPQNSLAALNGHPANGTWTLQIQDTQSGNTGTLLNWSLKLNVGTNTIVLNQPSGNLMDQNANANAGQASDFYATPMPLNNTPFSGPYDPNTIPLIVPGPHVTSTQAVLGNGSLAPIPVGQNSNPDNLVTDNTVSGLDVTFDRDMDPTSFGVGQVLRIMGPAGLVVPTNVIVSPANANPSHIRTFRILFPTQQLSGTYTISLSANIKSAAGDKMDSNLNAGFDVLRGFSPTGTNTPITTPSSDTPITVGPQKTISSFIDLTNSNGFPIQGATLSLNISDLNDPDLTAVLIAHDPSGDPTKDITIPLFSGVGTAGSHQDFQDTIFDDNATVAIQNGGAPFFGSYRPQSPLSVLLNATSARLFELQIINGSAVNSGTLNHWSLTLLQNVPGTGLGEPVADRTQVGFRIFTMDPTNPLSSNTWTAVGPAAIGGGGGTGAEGAGASSRSGRIGGIVIDPSDPSGNTVFIAGASGGVWKTTNFLTTDPQGPTYVPLTDFGPDFGLNIGSITVFGRNNDTNQSIVFAATGEGDTATPGVGFLRSMDGGSTWTILDSLTNVDKSGNPLPLTGAAADGTTRDHTFVGTTMFKVIVDPKPTKTGDAIVYAAVADPAGQGRGGIYRSIDTGKHWTRVLAGDATDITLDPESGFVNAFSNPTGNLQIGYAALRGVGVYQTQNEGVSWTQLLGNVGDPFFQDISKFPVTPVPISGSTAAPSGGGRIVLAKPSLIANNAAENLLYEGWLYVAVVTPGALGNPAGSLQGLYMTKDFGRNWTKIRLPNNVGGLPNGTVEANPSNDTSLSTDVDPLGNPSFGTQGNYDVSLIADPNNPNVVYLGGTADGNATGLIRVDTTGISDPYAFYMGQNGPSNAVLANTNDPFGLGNPNNAPTATIQYNKALGLHTQIDARLKPTINMVYDPFNTLAGNSTFYTDNASSFSNSGGNVRWIPFDQAVGSTDQHRVVAMIDPLTGQTRLIFGDDQGVFSDLVAPDGTLIDHLGNINVSPLKVAPDVDVPIGSRNGNLQITQFYYGAAQPSNIAAQASALQGMFFGQAQDDGGPNSVPNIIQPGQAGYGNLVWNGPGGDGGGVATDQNSHTTSPNGDVFQYFWPCCNGNVTDFFQVNGVGQTTGLVRNINPGGQVPDPQWPFEGVLNFAVNQLDADQIVISSAQGRIYRTENRGQFWLPIAEPGTDIKDSAQSLAMAYGAPQPNPPGGTAVLDNFIYVGTNGGHIYVTFVGGGPGQWTDISQGLDGSSVMAIVTNPLRGSHEAYAVTRQGVYHMVDSSAANASWTKINGPVNAQGNPLPGNIFSFTHNIFGDPTLSETAARSLTSIQADWRYVIPDDFNNPNSPTHPVLYVGGMAGVYRSFDNGQTWSYFPDSGTGSLLNSPYPTTGGLPLGQVTDLDLSLGFIDPTNGQPNESTGSNVLLATTFGRGEFAIRLAPIVLPTSLKLDQSVPAPGGSDSGLSNSDSITNVKNPFIDGFSEPSAFGNTVTINLIDETPGDATFGQVIGTGQTDAMGHLAHIDPVSQALVTGVQITASLTDGVKTIGVQAQNQSGTLGNIATLQFTLITTRPGTPTGFKLLSDTGLSTTDDITNVNAPSFQILPSGPNLTAGAIELFRDGGTTPVAIVNIPAGPIGGPVTITDPGPVPDGPHTYTIEQVDVAGNISLPPDPSLMITIDTVAPPQPAAPKLNAADDSGVKGDNITNVTQPHLVGMLAPETVDPLAQVQIISATGSVLGTALSDPVTGNYIVQFITPLAPNTYTVRIQAEDVAGNISQQSAPLTIKIQTAAPTQPTVALLPSDDSGKPGDNITSVTQPHLFGSTDPNIFVDLIDTNGDVSGTPGTVLATVSSDVGGSYLIQFPNPLPDGVYHIQARARDVANNTSLSPVLTLTIDTTAPSTAPTLGLLPADDTGILGDGITSVRRPHLSGKTEAFGVVDIVDGSGNILAETTADASGNYVTQLPNNLVNGTISLRARATDAAGNRGPASTPPFTLTIVTTAGDYDNDGQGDLALYRNTTGQALIKLSAGGGKLDQIGQPGDIPLQGDFDADGKTDVAVYRPSNGLWTIHRSQLGTETISFGGPLFKPVMGDFDGDGKADIGVYLTTSQTWYLILSHGGVQVTKVAGSQAGDVPVPGTYDGGQTSELAVYRPATSQFIIQGPGGTTRTTTVGTPNASNIPFAADFIGSGKAQPSVYQLSTGTWSIGGVLSSLKFGIPNVDLPVPLDFDGDGKADFGLYRQTTGQWILVESKNGLVMTPFGAPSMFNLGDTPISAPLSYLSRSIGASSTSQVRVASKGAGSVSSPAALDFGQQALGLSTAPVAITSSSIGSSLSSAAVSQTLPPAQPPTQFTTLGKRRVNVVPTQSHQLQSLLSHKQQHDSTLELALTSLGRIKRGRFLAGS